MPLKFANNQSLTSTTALPSAVPTDNLILISTQTASNSATISFTTGLDSTYDEYVFKFINIHPSVDNTDFQFNMSTDGGSNYNVTKTTTAFAPFHNEADTDTGLSYSTANDLAQSTAFQNLLGQSGIGNDNDQSASGYLKIFNPSSTTYVKHFIARNNYSHPSDYTVEYYVAGYGNTTSAVNAIRFQMSSGNIDDGIIKLYGVKKS
jgi:hypothetical protein